MVAGVDHRGRLTRSLLRFKTQDEAERAAGIILEVESVREVPLSPPVEEIVAEMRLRVPLILLYAAILWMGLGVVTLPRILDVVEVAVWVVMMLFIAGALTLIGYFWQTPVRVWIRQEGNSLLLRTQHNVDAVIPQRVEWRDARTLVLRVRRARIGLAFATGRSGEGVPVDPNPLSQGRSKLR